jgi:signal transduction histidine kinase
VGAARYERRRHRDAAAARDLAAERERAEVALRRASQERLDTTLDAARKLHDVIEHSVALIHVQSIAALHRLDDAPATARPTLEAIKRASAESLDEFRSALEALNREVDPPTVARPPPIDDVAPTPRAQGATTVPAGLDRLPLLAAQARGDGLTVRIDLVGPIRSLPAEVDMTAYRIVREALNNVRRHASATTATVRIARTDADLEISVDDDGLGTCGLRPAPGYGLRTLHEITRSLGGELFAGDRPEGGFRVSVRLPLPGAPS